MEDTKDKSNYTRLSRYFVHSLDDLNTKIEKKHELAKLNTSENIPFLIELLLNEKCDINYRVYVAKLLGKLKDARAVEPLLKTSFDIDPFLSCWSIDSLGLIKDERAFEFLMKFLDIQYTNRHWKDKEIASSVRHYAAQSLGMFGDVRALEALKWLAQHDKTRWGRGNKVSEAAQRAISQIKEK